MPRPGKGGCRVRCPASLEILPGKKKTGHQNHGPAVQEKISGRTRQKNEGGGPAVYHLVFPVEQLQVGKEVIQGLGEQENRPGSGSAAEENQVVGQVPDEEQGQGE